MRVPSGEKEGAANHLDRWKSSRRLLGKSCVGCGASVARQYAIAYDATPKPRRSNRTAWTWLGGLLALIAGLVGFVLSALAANDGRITAADAFAGLSTLAVALFSLIGMMWPRIGGLVALVFATLGAGLTGSTGPRAAMVMGFVGGLMLWFGRRNHARHGTMRKLARVTVLAGVVALKIAEHVPTNHGRPPAQNVHPHQSRPVGSGKPRQKGKARGSADLQENNLPGLNCWAASPLPAFPDVPNRTESLRMAFAMCPAVRSPRKAEICHCEFHGRSISTGPHDSPPAIGVAQVCKDATVRSLELFDRIEGARDKNRPSLEFNPPPAIRNNGKPEPAS